MVFCPGSGTAEELLIGVLEGMWEFSPSSLHLFSSSSNDHVPRDSLWRTLPSICSLAWFPLPAARRSAAAFCR